MVPHSLPNWEDDDTCVTALLAGVDNVPDDEQTPYPQLQQSAFKAESAAWTRFTLGRFVVEYIFL